MYIDLFFEEKAKAIRIDSTQFHALSQQISRNPSSAPNAYFINQAQFKPVITDNFVGDTSQGGACNCEDITFNAHGNGTHTECVGHVSKERVYMTQVQVPKFMTCQLIHAQVQQLNNGDEIINLDSWDWDKLRSSEAVIINSGISHIAQQFSGTNPCYIDIEVLSLLNTKGINHVLTDLPSVDRENDGGALAGHKAFFGYPEKLNYNKTISELLYIQNELAEGDYILGISFAEMETDAVPSDIKIYPLTN